MRDIDRCEKKDRKSFWKIMWKKVDPTAFQDVNDMWHDIKLETGIRDLN